MTPAFSARRRADDFEALLSPSHDAPLTERDAARFAALLEVVADLRALPEVTPRPEFVSSLRESLMAEADTVLVRQPSTPPRLAMPITTRKRDRRVATLLGGAALVGATATMAVAAQTALPGESLYGVKRGIEAAQVRFAGDDAARGHTLLAQAETRLSELEQVAAGDGGTDKLAPDTLDAFTDQSGDGVRSLLRSYEGGGSQQDVQDARDFTVRSMERLDALEQQLPNSARDELLAAGRTLTDLDMEISSACLTCTGGITTTPDFLLSSAPMDLLTGLDSDELTLEAAPVSGQDLTGITVPEVLQSPGANLPGAPSTDPTLAPQTLLPDPTSPDPTQQDPTKTDPTKPVKEVTQGVTDTTSDLANQLDGVTGNTVTDSTGGLLP